MLSSIRDKLQKVIGYTTGLNPKTEKELPLKPYVLDFKFLQVDWKPWPVQSPITWVPSGIRRGGDNNWLILKVYNGQTIISTSVKDGTVSSEQSLEKAKTTLFDAIEEFFNLKKHSNFSDLSNLDLSIIDNMIISNQAKSKYNGISYSWIKGKRDNQPSLVFKLDVFKPNDKSRMLSVLSAGTYTTISEETFLIAWSKIVATRRYIQWNFLQQNFKKVSLKSDIPNEFFKDIPEPTISLKEMNKLSAWIPTNKSALAQLSSNAFNFGKPDKPVVKQSSEQFRKNIKTGLSGYFITFQMRYDGVMIANIETQLRKGTKNKKNIDRSNCYAKSQTLGRIDQLTQSKLDEVNEKAFKWYLYLLEARNLEIPRPFVLPKKIKNQNGFVIPKLDLKEIVELGNILAPHYTIPARRTRIKPAFKQKK